MSAAPLFWLGVLVGLILLVRFLRGKRVGTEPFCRRCAFNLTGLPKTSTRCPECGSDITAPGSVRVGERVRSKRTGILAGLLLLVGLPFAGVALLEDVSSVNVIEYKPAFWLAYDARINNRRTEALNELLSRVQFRRLQPAAVASLVDHALTQQADHAPPWDSAWGNFIEQAETLGAVTPDQWGRYGRQIIYFEAEPDRRPRPGEINHSPLRAPRVLPLPHSRPPVPWVGGHFPLHVRDRQSAARVFRPGTPRRPMGAHDVTAPQRRHVVARHPISRR